MKNSKIKKIIENYMRYLLKIGEDYAKNKHYYFTYKTFNNKSIFVNYFNESIPFKVIHKIFISYIELLILNLENASYSSNINPIKEDFPSKNFENILKISTLDLKLRGILIKLFLILYINAIIDEKKMHIYRTQFQLNIDDSFNQGLFGAKESRYYKFYNMLLNISARVLR